MNSFLRFDAGTGSLVLADLFMVPTWPHKNGPWAWNTPLPRDEEPAQPVPGVSPRREVSFPISDSVNALLSWLEVCASHGTLANFTVGLLSMGRDRVPPLWHQKGKLLCVSPIRRETCWPQGTNAHYRSTPCSVSPLCKWNIILPGARRHCVLTSDSDTEVQWAQVFGLSSLVAGIVMISIASMYLGVLPWDW